MTQKDRELLVKELCERLPYDVKVLCLRDFNHDWYKLETVDLGDNEVYVTTYKPYTNRYVKIEEVKPYLFPLLSMTEEQSKIYHELVGGMFGTGVLINLECLIDFFDRNHLDWKGLIPLGLAIDATNLNIYKS